MHAGSGAAEAGEGLEVVAGVVETHGRQETESLLADLDVIPRRRLDIKASPWRSWISMGPWPATRP